MSGSTFKTNPVALHELLKKCDDGKLQLPDFQRSWVWDEDRIKSLIASISRAFPVGALMTLETGGGVNFKPRPIEGAPETARKVEPAELLLDGQQRMTSLYQVTLHGQVVKTITPKKQPVERWFFIDIKKALDPSVDREEAIISVPADKIVRSDFNRSIDHDYSTTEREFENLVFPLSRAFDGMAWQMEFVTWANANGRMQELWPTVQQFYTEILANFTGYHVPVIALDKTTTKEAVCTVFEKVNTGGKPLDAFELVTAIYAADGHELRKDWYGEGRDSKGRHGLFVSAQKLADAEKGILANVANTDFLHVISLFHTRDLRRAAVAANKEGKDLPQITGKRGALLNLPLSAYKKYEKLAEQGFLKAAKFLFTQRVYRLFDLPYQTQIIPLAAILADIGDAWELEGNREKIQQWYWCGVLGELYGSAVETRIARDFQEVPAWLNGGKVPATVSEASFRPDRLKTMRMRLSAAYKGVNALLMKARAQDFRSGQEFDHTVFFGENVDIHHIFPKKWCEDNKIRPEVYDSIINKTPLSYRTNRIIGGVAPSAYLAKLENGSAEATPVDPVRLNGFLASHLIDPTLLRTNEFAAFMEARQQALLSLIAQAMGKQVEMPSATMEQEYSDELDEDEAEAEFTVAAE
ncbi:DUF262 domain-containing protein [Sinorhizobium americanum]|uniref:GmrSD restriction endonucleases N-terminal domain-containing protein n=1 Tax=Sinorhizobium americanum TaxID=194963 RepID=A0A4R2BTL8_9HYPH|nr:DUF262 domain-containing protein [Sinorhizobium americanum]TCN30172.1 hypothetical protein EV184_10843 [Sinorhizobium americanum]